MSESEEMCPECGFIMKVEFYCPNPGGDYEPILVCENCGYKGEPY